MSAPLLKGGERDAPDGSAAQLLGDSSHVVDVALNSERQGARHVNRRTRADSEHEHVVVGAGARGQPQAVSARRDRLAGIPADSLPGSRSPTSRCCWAPSWTRRSSASGSWARACRGGKRSPPGAARLASVEGTGGAAAGGGALRLCRSAGARCRSERAGSRPDAGAGPRSRPRTTVGRARARLDR